jgi:hypothetical protein
VVAKIATHIDSLRFAVFRVVVRRAENAFSRHHRCLDHVDECSGDLFVGVRMTQEQTNVSHCVDLLTIVTASLKSDLSFETVGSSSEYTS